jgi:hypothetical protein
MLFLAIRVIELCAGVARNITVSFVTRPVYNPRSLSAFAAVSTRARLRHHYEDLPQM